MRAGHQLERNVQSAIERLIEDGTLGLNADCCAVYLNKGYFSKDRESEIVADVSIELTAPNTTTPSLLWIWECKDYGGAVPVGDIEEFHAKLEQIGADKTKGTFITTGRYQRSAITYAASKGIGLTRLIDGANVHVESIPDSYYPASSASVCEHALTYDGDQLRWNSFTHSLPHEAERYFFHLASESRGVYSADLYVQIMLELRDSRERITWLDRPEERVDLAALLETLRGK